MKYIAGTTILGRVLSTILMLGGLGAVAVGETIGVFYNSAIPQHASAAGDIRTVFEAEGFSVETYKSSPCRASQAPDSGRSAADRSINRLSNI